MTTFKNLVRVATGNQAHYGELLGIANNKYNVQRLNGNPFDGFVSTNNFQEFESVRPHVFERENAELNINTSFYHRLKKLL